MAFNHIVQRGLRLFYHQFVVFGKLFLLDRVCQEILKPPQLLAAWRSLCNNLLLAHSSGNTAFLLKAVKCQYFEIFLTVDINLTAAGRKPSLTVSLTGKISYESNTDRSVVETGRMRSHPVPPGALVNQPIPAYKETKNETCNFLNFLRLSLASDICEQHTVHQSLL